MSSAKSPNANIAKNVSFFNIIQSPFDDRDMNADTLFEEEIRVPKTLNWSRYLQRVRNQCVQGTSLAHAGVCILECLNRKFGKKTITFSAQFIYNHRQDKENNLMCGRELMKILLKSGCCRESLCPNGTTEKHSFESLTDAKENVITSYASVKTVSSLKMALTVFGPCVITFPVYNHTPHMWKPHNDDEKLGGHAMTVVGYNKKGFILRNSWGKHWETKGYCIYPYEDWGYHDEVWCIADKSIYEKWRNLPKNVLSRGLRHMLKNVRRNNTHKEVQAPRVQSTNEIMFGEQPIVIPTPRKIVQSTLNKSPEYFEGKNEMKKDLFNIFFKPVPSSKNASELPEAEFILEEQSKVEGEEEQEKVSEEVAEENNTPEE